MIKWKSHFAKIYDFCYFIIMTRIYALTDSHQEANNLSRLLSEIYNIEKHKRTPFLIVDSGDLFKGIYDKDLSVEAYLKIKKLLPQSQVFITLGNNDFGFSKGDFEYLKNTIEKFKKAGINFVCANLFDSKTEKPADFIPQYNICEINGQRILITGICVNNSCAKRFGYTLLPPVDCVKTLMESVKEPYDKVIVLSHHWYPYSLDLKIKCPEIDLIIGGHEHSPIEPDYENNIFYPLSFARSIYSITLDDEIKNVTEILLEKCVYIPELELPVRQYELETGLKQPIARRVYNLTKTYSEPCPLGTFISDNMKRVGQTDIAFHSTGFSMYHLNRADSDVITKYDISRVMCSGAPLEKIYISVEELKKVFENATLFRMEKNRGNSRFIQCSQNITVTGIGNKDDKTYKILQISIDGENLLDENCNPINSQKKYSCTIDAYIGSAEQGFDVLKNIPKTRVLKNDKEILLNELLYDSLCAVGELKVDNSEYSSWQIIDKE